MVSPRKTESIFGSGLDRKVFSKLWKLVMRDLMRFWWHSQVYEELSRELKSLELALQIIDILEKLTYFRVKMPRLQGTYRLS